MITAWTERANTAMRLTVGRRDGSLRPTVTLPDHQFKQTHTQGNLMTVINEKDRIAYFSIPKVACSSQKRLHHEIIHGAPFEATRSNENDRLHAVYKSEKFDRKAFTKLNDYWTYTMVRDPVKRILSAYSQKIVQKNEQLAETGTVLRPIEKLIEAGLNPYPSINEFCEDLSLYFKKSFMIKHHVRHYKFYIGNQLERFNRVYKIEETAQLEADLTERLGRKVQLPYANQSSNKQFMDDLTQKSLDLLIEFAQPDYELLDGLYTPPSLASFQKKKSVVA
ncbi:sulfotransferase family 2 domain-containing protein [Falsihalocynthiibacter sp. SS001]|uniref:sulfotransferase family 2 domain-containing protein n=1 Tax=Falsihalocynthiibacter sp. SS001 TaxID=3349698 RepID=UPI0036D2229F